MQRTSVNSVTETGNVCTTCTLAEWYKTAGGKLHPSGGGLCKWEMPRIVMPISFYYIGHHGQVPHPDGGGFINRRDLKPCPAWRGKVA